MTFSQHSGVPVFPLSFYYSINRLCLLPSQHFPSYLFPKNVPQKTHKMTFLRLKFINFLGEHTHKGIYPDCSEHLWGLFFQCVHLQNLTLHTCLE